MSQGSPRLVGGAAVEEAIATLRAKLLLIAAIALIGLAAGIVIGAGKGSSPELRMLVKLSPLGSNSSAVALGVSSPKGPIAADFVSDRVLGKLADELRRSKQQVEDEVALEAVAGDTEQLVMAVAGDTAASRHLMRAWYLVVQRVQRAVLLRAIRQTREGYEDELTDLTPLRARRESIENIARLTGLEGSLRSDISILKGPEVSEASFHSPLFYVAVGLIIGVIGGITAALGIGLMEQNLRTPRALSAQFGLPVVADLREGHGDGGAGLAERLKIVADGDPDHPALVVVEAGPEGSAQVAAAALCDVSSPLAVGPLGSAEAQASLSNGDAWVLAVSPGATRADHAADVGVELAALPRRPLGLVLV